MNSGTLGRSVGIGAVVFLAVGCAQVASSQVGPSTVFASYSANYHDDTNQLSLSATFSVGGTTGTSLHLDGESNVAVDGETLPGSSDIVNQYVYALSETETNVSSVHTFVYTDNNGKTYTNALTLPSDVAIDTGSGTVIHSSSPFVVNWISFDALQSTDEVQVTLQRSDDSNSVMSEDFGTGDKAGQVVFTPTQLAPLGTGNFRLIACRQQSLPAIDVTEAGGSIWITRCLPEVPVMIAP